MSEDSQARRLGRVVPIAGSIASPSTEVHDEILHSAAPILLWGRSACQDNRQLHDWFVTGKAGKDVTILNERVYAELFLTPSSDPWLGLVAQDTYTALENDGRVTLAKP